MIRYTLFDPATGDITGLCSALADTFLPGSNVKKGHPPEDGRRYRVDLKTLEWAVDQAPIEFDYREQRATAFPAVGEQLDALRKIVEALMRGEQPPAEALAVLDQVKQVKQRFPKE